VQTTRRALADWIDRVLLGDSLERDEQPAVRALEAVVALRGSRQQLVTEGLAAVGADHVVDRRLGGIVGHAFDGSRAHVPARVMLERGDLLLTSVKGLDVIAWEGWTRTRGHDTPQHWERPFV
jgi:hypothetical protein